MIRTSFISVNLAIVKSIICISAVFYCAFARELSIFRTFEDQNHDKNVLFRLYNSIISSYFIM
jgi:hypothetical protein